MKTLYEELTDQVKKYSKIGVGVGVGGLGAYGVHKAGDGSIGQGFSNIINHVKNNEKEPSEFQKSLTNIRDNIGRETKAAKELVGDATKATINYFKRGGTTIGDVFHNAAKAVGENTLHEDQPISKVKKLKPKDIIINYPIMKSNRKLNIFAQLNNKFI